MPGTSFVKVVVIGKRRPAPTVKAPPAQGSRAGETENPRGRLVVCDTVMCRAEVRFVCTCEVRDSGTRSAGSRG